MVNFNSRKTEDIIRFLIGVTLIVWLNILAGATFYRLDLTEERRYSIKEPTREMLRNLDDVVYVEVYLEGELNASFKRLQNAIRETLEEFRVYAGDNFQYSFNDPSLAMGNKAKGEFMRSLMDKGIQPTNVIDDRDGQRIEKLIFPGAIISYGGVEAGVMLLKGNQAATAEEKLNQSIEGIEYALATAVRNLTSLERKKIAIIKGHNELDSLEMAGFTEALATSYEVGYDYINEERLENYDALVIAKPRAAFTEVEKYHLDQYLIKGGKIMLLLDKLHANMDSASNAYNYSFPYTINLEDQLFKYGIRFNNDLIQDKSAAGYPIVIGQMGDQPQIKLQPWPFYPVINRYANHPITRNLDAALLRFASTIDTVKAAGVKKTPLMFTSQYSRSIAAPANVSIQTLRNELTPENLNKQHLMVACLLEGKFSSLYKNRFIPEGIATEGFVSDAAVAGAKLLVVSDGDIAYNDVDPRTGQPQPLGYYPFPKHTFANQDFLMNAMAYMLDDTGLITARNKEVKIRPLDTVKVAAEKTKWQVINMLLPILLLVAYGIGRYYWRKKKYT